MNLFQSFSLPPAEMYAVVQAILTLRVQFPAEVMRVFLRPFFGDGFGTLFFPRLNGQLAWAAIYDNDNTLIVIDGIRSQAEAQLVIDGYSGSLLDGFNDPTNQYFRSNASVICAEMRRRGLWNKLNVLISGYSAGAATAGLVYSFRTNDELGAPQVRVLAFAAPRPGGYSDYVRMQSLTQIEHYFFFDDPITNFPLRAGTYTWLPFLIGARAARRWSNFTTFVGGWQIQANGGYTQGVSSSDAEITSQTAFDVWWNGLESDTLSPHNLYRFVAQFQSAPSTNRTHSGQVPNVVEQPENLGGPGVARLEREAVNLVRDIQQAQDAIGLNIPPQRLVRAYRQGKVWYAAFGDTTIMSTPSRRRARGCANELNAFLRRLQQSALVDPAAINAAMAAYLEAAADPTSGITPTLNTRIPQ